MGALACGETCWHCCVEAHDTVQLWFRANHFSVGKLTAGEATWEVCVANQKVMTLCIISLADSQEVMDGFNSLGFPNCIEAIDSTHIAICSPVPCVHEVINQKGYFTIVLWAVVDHHGYLTYANAGWSGRVHSAKIFRSSLLPELLEWREFSLWCA